MPAFNINSLNDEEKFALFYGIMLGDGCLSYYRIKGEREKFAVVITGSSLDDQDFFEKILASLLKSFGRTSFNIKKRRDCNAIEINFIDRMLFRKINSYGFPIGKKGPNIIIPKYFYDNNLVRYVVAGFMATDGSLVLTKNPNKYYPRIEGNGISKNLIKQIHDYFSLIGMKGAFYLAKRKVSNLSFNIHQQYRFQFNGHQNLKIFENKIGFVNPKYQAKLKQFLQYCSDYDRVIMNVPPNKQKFVRIKSLNGSRGS